MDLQPSLYGALGDVVMGSNPLGHSQTNFPGTFRQTALDAHGFFPLHSSMSAQPLPPVAEPVNPFLHKHLASELISMHSMLAPQVNSVQNNNKTMTL